jgi:hypothetical protein
MVRQLLSDEPLKESERSLATFPVQTQANCNLTLDAVALLIFPTNAHAKQKKHIRQGLWKPKALTIRNICTRISELNAQLESFPFPTGLLREEKMKSAFINLCLPDWQQEFLKTGINECSSSWDEMLSKAETMEQAQNAIVEVTASNSKENKREREEGEVDTNPSSKAPPKKKVKTPFCCKLHGCGQNHSTDKCKVLNAEFEKIKQNRKPRAFSGQQTNPNNQQPPNTKPNWSDINKKHTNTSHSTEQLQEVICMTQKKAMEDAKTHCALQIENDLNAMQIKVDAEEQVDKMHEMESFINSMQGELSEEEEEEQTDELTQAKLDELAGFRRSIFVKTFSILQRSLRAQCVWTI